LNEDFIIAMLREILAEAEWRETIADNSPDASRALPIARRIPPVGIL
jgi:hypothetical protein